MQAQLHKVSIKLTKNKLLQFQEKYKHLQISLLLGLRLAPKTNQIEAEIDHSENQALLEKSKSKDFKKLEKVSVNSNHIYVDGEEEVSGPVQVFGIGPETTSDARDFESIESISQSTNNHKPPININQKAKLKILENQIDTWLDKSDGNLEFLEKNAILVAECNLEEYCKKDQDQDQHDQIEKNGRDGQEHRPDNANSFDKLETSGLQKADEIFEIEFKMLNNEIEVSHQPFIKFESKKVGKSIETELAETLKSIQLPDKSGAILARKIKTCSNNLELPPIESLALFQINTVDIEKIKAINNNNVSFENENAMPIEQSEFENQIEQNEVILPATKEVSLGSLSGVNDPFCPKPRLLGSPSRSRKAPGQCSGSGPKRGASSHGMRLASALSSRIDIKDGETGKRKATGYRGPRLGPMGLGDLSQGHSHGSGYGSGHGQDSGRPDYRSRLPTFAQNLNLAQKVEMESLTKDLLTSHGLDNDDSSLAKLKVTINQLSVRLSQANETQNLLASENNYLKRTMLLAEDISSDLAPNDMPTNELMNRLIAMKFENTRLLTDLENTKCELKSKDEITTLQLNKKIGVVKEKFRDKLEKCKKLDGRKKDLINEQEMIIKRLEVEVEKLRDQNRMLIDCKEEMHGNQNFSFLGEQNFDPNKTMTLFPFTQGGNLGSCVGPGPAHQPGVLRENNKLAYDNYSNMTRIFNLKSQIDNYKLIAERREKQLEDYQNKFQLEQQKAEHAESQLEKSAARWANERSRLLLKVRHERFNAKNVMREFERDFEPDYLM